MKTDVYSINSEMLFFFKEQSWKKKITLLSESKNSTHEEWILSDQLKLNV